MKTSFVAVLGCLSHVLFAAAHAGMSQILEEIKRATVENRQSTSLIGDLAILDDFDLSHTGRAVKSILQGAGSPQDLTSRYSSVPPRDSSRCAEDTCCIWKYIADDMHNIFVGTAGRCNSFARAAVRVGFHDAGTYSIKAGPAGGADGSIVLAGECEDRGENSGMQEICSLLRQWHGAYEKYGVGMADLIQMAANVATVSCPLGPRVRSYVGRKDNSTPAPEDTLPSPFGTADELIALFEDKTISASGLIALLGAHTVSQQRFIVKDRAGDPQDSTPGVWDSRYFRETADKNAPERVLKMESDVNLAKDARTQAAWRSFSSPIQGQLTWNNAYAREYVRLSLLGVDNINELTDCTKVLPRFTGSFSDPDEGLLDEYLHGKLDYAGDALLNGDLIPNP